MCFSVNFLKILKTYIEQNTSVQFFLTDFLSQGVSNKSFSEYCESFL